MRSARKRSFRPELSGLKLEGRQLLSTVAGSMARPAHAAAHVAPMNHGGMPHAAAHVTPMYHVRMPQILAAAVQQNDIEAMGLVIKAPQNRVFYEDYVGPKLAELNAVGAIGEPLPNGNFQFIGINQGLISPKVKATYVWGIDRSGKLPTGPFPGRPDIRFDATVAIKVVPGQTTTVTVTDLVSKKVSTFALPPVPGNNNSIGVIISGSLLPSTGLAPSQYRYAYWPEDGNAGSTHIASFAPGFHDIQVGVPE